MSQYDVNTMMKQLKKVYVEKVVQNGFEDGHLYNDELLKLTDVELQEFDGLKKIIGKTKAMAKSKDIDINNQGLTDEQYEENEKLEKKKRSKEGLTEEEKKRLAELKKKKENRESAISILRGISIRMPLMIYGAEIKNEDEEITINNFTSLIDPQTWEEFMPKGVSKQLFNSFKKYYDEDIFSAAGKRIRAMARVADHQSIEERIERITSIFNTLKSATYRVSWEFTCKTTKILLLYIFLGRNRNVVNTKFPYPIKRLEVIRRFNQKSIAFNQSLS